MQQEQFEKELNQYDEAYFHRTPLISDQAYNKLVDEYELLYGKYHPNSSKNLETHTRTKLPKYSPSLDKIKLLTKFNLYKERHPGDLILMDKLDGMTLIIHYHDQISIYTHSTDGYYGSDVSHLLPYLTIPKNIKDILIRGELVINRKIFIEKYSKEYANERNLMSIINATKNIKYDIIKDFSFVAFEIQSSTENLLQQLILLKELNFEVVPYKIEKDLNYDVMTDELKNGHSDYLRDGKVIASLDIEDVTEGLPKHKIAFKTIGDVLESTVIAVEWNISEHMKLKPRVNIEEILLEGGHVNWVTGINANFILKNNIGPGTVLLISRDITPKIYEVVSSTKASLPDEYEWDENHTDIIGVMNDQVLIKRIYKFFDLLEAKNLGLKTIEKLFFNFKTIQSIMDATLEQLIKVKGIQRKGAERILTSISQCKNNINLVKVMAASCLFPNFAEKKLQQILNHTPTLTKIMLDLCENHLTVQDIQNIPGIKETAEIFINHIDNFKVFLSEIPTVKTILLQTELKSQHIDMIEIQHDDEDEHITPPLFIPDEKPQTLTGMVIVFSGDKKSTADAIAMGAIVDKGVTKNTTLLVVDQVGSMNAKEKRCKDKIPIMSLNDFKTKYLV